MRQLTIYLLILILLNGCSVAAYKYREHKSTELSQIHTVYSKAIHTTKTDTTRNWRSGITGNIWINTIGGQNYGLCYQWQNYVYKETLSTIKKIGWESSGIVINKGTDWEHHAVIVYDPNVIKKNTILVNKINEQVFVLDPWHTGNADIYTLESWLKIPVVVTVPASLEEVTL